MDATVATLISNLSNGEADQTECARIYVDVMARLGLVPVLAQLNTAVTPMSGVMGLPGNMVQLLLAFYNSYQLGELSIREANWLLPNWRSAVGTPYNFVRESFNAQTIQLVPAPNDGKNAQSLTSYTTDILPVWLKLPVTLLVLADEYQRESSHQKLPVANACRALGELLIGILIRHSKGAGVSA